MAVPDSALHLEQSRTSSTVNGNGNGFVIPAYKRRRVSAKRDFPPGCGRSAARVITSGAEGGGNDAGGVSSEGDLANKNGDAFIGQSGAPEIVNECETAGVSQGLLTGPPHSLGSAEEPGHTNGAEAKVEKSEVVTGEEQIATAEELDITGPVILEKTSELEVTDELMEIPGNDVADSETHMIRAENTLACPPADFLEKTTAHKCPPRRSVSAIRDFPPFCGRNAPILKKEESTSMNEASMPEDNDMGEEKPFKVGEAPVGKGEIVAQEEDETFRNRDSSEDEVDGEALSGDGDAIEVEPLAVVFWRKEDDFEGSGEIGMAEKHAERDYFGSPQRSTQNQVSPSEEATENGDCEDLEKPTGKEIVLYSDVNGGRRKYFDVLEDEERFLNENDDSEDQPERVIVLGIMASPNSPWQRNWNRGMELPPEDGLTESKGKKQREQSKSPSRKRRREGEGFSGARKDLRKELILHEEPSNVNADQMVVYEPGEPSELEALSDDFNSSARSRGSVNPPPFGHASSGGEADNKTGTVTRNKVRETLRLYQAVCRKLLQEEEAKSKEARKRVDLQAAKILKEKGRFVNTGKQIIGDVPGVEVGDEFQYRMELNIIGLHRAIQAGIDYVKHEGQILATSIVSSGAYNDFLEHPDFLVYTGQGGNVIGKDKEPEDQKLERGNLALSNSISAKNPVRVIRGLRESQKASILYTYDGLYLVDKRWEEKGPHGKQVFKFRLNRIPGQPELAWKTVKKSKRRGTREGLCVTDISHGKERLPIGAVNTIDDEKPPQFKYITQVIYPDWCRRLPPVGCNCTDEFCDFEKCSCAVKNGGEIPYTNNGAIVEVKPLVYECGPSCKCPPGCHNRVTQWGIKFPLEIFKTDKRGWGVRSLTSIPSGSFVCEYVGELLDDQQAEELTGNDEYLFDIGNRYKDNNIRLELSCLMPDAHSASSEVIEDVGFTIDASRYGNVGRFVNHSCSPNLYAQNVLYDHDDKRIPRIMFFAAENIPPLQELTYHYNYTIGEVRDSNGNVKMKSCFCGSPECTGRMY